MSLLKQIPTGTRFGRLVTVSQVYGRTSPRLGLVLQLVAVRWLGMVLADPRAAPGSRSWPAAASPGYPPVSLRSWAGTWLPSSR